MNDVTPTPRHEQEGLTLCEWWTTQCEHRFQVHDEDLATLAHGIARALATAERAHAMKWTTDKPSRPGWYWHQSQSTKAACIEVVQKGSQLFIQGFDHGYDIELFEVYGEWAGPLSPPEEPLEVPR